MTEISYILLMELMTADGRQPDRETFVELLRSAKKHLTEDEYQRLQESIRLLLSETML